MRTMIINVPEKDSAVFNAIIKRFGFSSRTISENEKEEIAIARWIEQGMKSEDVSKEDVRKVFRKNGVTF